MLYGVAYYYEYQPYERLERDLDLMAEARLSVIRVGESVWSTWEPEDGVFDLDWLEPVIEGAHARDIAVVLGTPTYAMPPWLVRKYPEVTAERGTGRRIPYGHRQDADYSHPAFRFHAERIARKVVERYRDHPAVVGYQVDNEPGMELFHNRAAFQGFVDHLRRTYGTVEELNERWGLVYWSHRISRWDELWAPDGNTVASYDLAWRRYQSAITTDFIAWQAALVRELARPDQFVTTCMALTRPAFDPADLNRALDIAAVNPYYAMQDALALPPVPPGTAPRQFWKRDMGPWSIYQQADMTRGARDQAPFLVTETNALAIGESHQNHPAYDGQWRQAAWALVARGARMVEYWHWHSIHYGHEEYWLGVLNHDGEPGRCYAEVARIAGELERAGEAVVDLEPEADVAILFSTENRWTLGFHPPLAEADGRTPDRESYARIVDAFYEGLFAAKLQTALVFPQDLGTGEEIAARWPVLVVPALYAADDELLDRLDAYARAGGHLVVGFRTGYADAEARPRARGDARPPARGGRRDLRRVHEPDRPGAGAGRGGRAAAGARRRGGHRLGRRPRGRGRRAAGGVRAPAPRPLARRHLAGARRRPRDLRGHAAQPRAGRRARALAPLPRGGERRLGRAPGRGDRHGRAQPARRARALHLELVVGARHAGRSRPGAGPAVGRGAGGRLGARARPLGRPRAGRGGRVTARPWQDALDGRWPSGSSSGWAVRHRGADVIAARPADRSAPARGR